MVPYFFEDSFGACPTTKSVFEKVLRIGVRMTVRKMTLCEKVLAAALEVNQMHSVLPPSPFQIVVRLACSS